MTEAVEIHSNPVMGGGRRALCRQGVFSKVHCRALFCLRGPRVNAREQTLGYRIGYLETSSRA